MAIAVVKILAYVYSWMLLVCCCLTQVLHILICRQRQRAALTLAALLTRAVALEHDNTVGDSCGDESGTVAEAGPARVEVEGDVAEHVAQRAEEERHMPAEPGELEAVEIPSVNQIFPW